MVRQKEKPPTTRTTTSGTGRREAELCCRKTSLTETALANRALIQVTPRTTDSGGPTLNGLGGRVDEIAESHPGASSSIQSVNPLTSCPRTITYLQCKRIRSYVTSQNLPLHFAKLSEPWLSLSQGCLRRSSHTDASSLFEEKYCCKQKLFFLLFTYAHTY